MSDRYFQSYKEYFWQWEDSDGQVVASIPGGSTIAYRSFISDIIVKLAPQGLPPFGSLLLALIATNPDHTAILRLEEIFVGRLSQADQPMLHDALAFMKKLRDLPKQYKTDEKRILLMQAIFENCHSILSAKDSQRIADNCRNGFLNFQKMFLLDDFLMGMFRFDFRTVALLNIRFRTTDDIVNKIGSIPDIAQLQFEFEETPTKVSDQPLDLVDELVQNDKTFTTGSLVRWLWGGLNIPVHSALPSQQPVGGISDLTNKGDFDKLLISEFAYDDITFLSRLANNEALYIHREIPPANNDLNRVILIDASLKNWGTPKTIAFGVMLAIARHPKTDITCHAYVLGTEKYHPIAFDSVHDIINGLQIVEAGLTAAKGLEMFFEEHGTDHNMEVFLITEATTLKRPEMLKVMNEHHDGINYVVFTDAEGNVDLYKRHQRARKHVQHIKLPLNELWKRKQNRPAREQKNPPFEGRIPILIKSPDHTRKIVSSPDGEIFQLSNERLILKLYDKNIRTVKAKGWQIMFQATNYFTTHFEIGLSPSNEYVALLFFVNRKELSLINLNNGSVTTVPFTHWKSTHWPAFVFHQGKFFHSNHAGHWSVSLDGTVSSSDRIEQTIFKERHEELANLARGYGSSDMLLKNIKEIYINGARNLVLNIHELLFFFPHVRLNPAHDKSSLAKAEKVSEHEFRFADGSTVETTRKGYVILKSSNPEIPSVFVPTALDGVIGIATADRFAGNEYYYPDPKVQLTIESVGVSQLGVVKVLKEELNIALHEARDLAAQAGGIELGPFQSVKAATLMAKLQGVGATVNRHESTSQQKVSVELFHRDIMDRYISTIISNGA